MSPFRKWAGRSSAEADATAPSLPAPGSVGGIALASAVGVVFSGLLAAAALAAGYPPPTGAAEFAALLPSAVGLTMVGSVGFAAARSGHRAPMVLVLLAAVAAVAAEALAPAHQVVIGGERFTEGTLWIGVSASAWPVLLLVAAVVWSGEARLRTGREEPGYRRYGRWRVLTSAAVVGAAAAAALAATLLPSAEVPVGLAVWGLAGHGLTHAVAALLLHGPRFVLPMATLLAGAALAVLDTATVVPGASATVYLALWPGYLVAALGALAVEAVARGLVRLGRRAKARADLSASGAGRRAEPGETAPR
ncbi:hypothetical protein [Nocardiopsis nanhaiensis]